ncbi:MAG: hypothetical protein EPO13_05045 [Actinomycetota bacterium]|nr:MAG: hypothetical protein EPO13_05045 [Actinomycetota bacterium]
MRRRTAGRGSTVVGVAAALALAFTAPAGAAPQPVATPDAAETAPDAAVTVAVLANDAPADAGGPLRVIAVSADRDVAHGRVEIVDGGQAVRYTPDRGFTGTDTFYYRAGDGTRQSDPAQVTVSVVARRTLTVSPPPAAHSLATTTVTGSVSPAAAGPGPVRVTLAAQDVGNGEWIAVGGADAAADGSFAVAWKPTLGGDVPLQVSARWGDGKVETVAGISQHVDVTLALAVSGRLKAKDVRYTYRRGCPVTPGKLRRMTLTYWDFSGRLTRGDLVVRASAVKDLKYVFGRLLADRFPLQRVVPADAFKGKDVKAMEAGATSAFNCRKVTGNPYRLSQHSFGNAVDINTAQNPYVTSSRIYPAGSKGYLVRSPYRQGMILKGGVVTTAMARVGWLWGARWSHPDYQHFSSNGG